MREIPIDNTNTIVYCYVAIYHDNYTKPTIHL